MHCVGDVQNNGVGPCMGDSGGQVQKMSLSSRQNLFLLLPIFLQILGPLTWIDPSTSKAKLIGVASWVIRCGSSRYPSVYAEVAKVMDWVDKTTGFCGVEIPPGEDSINFALSPLFLF